jgi:hypothetical protein
MVRWLPYLALISLPQLSDESAERNGTGDEIRQC